MTLFSAGSDANCSHSRNHSMRAALPRRVHRLCVLVATAALLAVTCLPAPSSAAVEWVVQQVQVLHRHGSRSAVPSYNTTAICGATPCGYLNPEGEQMMVNVGSFLRKRYTTDTTVVDKAFLTSESYDLDVVSTYSTDVLRTLQSANLLLSGLFPNSGRLIPAIHILSGSGGFVLQTYLQPWVSLYGLHAADAQAARINPLVDARFPKFSSLTALGASLHSENFFSDYAKRWKCVSMLWDIAAAKRSIGQLPALAEKHYKDLQEIVAAAYRYMWYYNASDEFVVQQGGRGQPFLEQVVKNIDGFLAGTNTFKVMQYSAHDVTLGPVWGTLGDSSVNAVLPPYSQTLVLELVKRTSDGAHGVRVLRG
ncbi:putative membrane-bound acid phosphatase [Leptomonas pyrrhocoris]|uniref:Putative membrane-bound acid phosphatase n=1 Tax=Leptomonas pyrrhocoris TaxID=157538 RepID=A0A0M9G968_LEPPY|nr:putative membrane-bound acid phosphatase [Leptomonas pyrrhocoris]KPA85129.1 putative membrane-bound acid phosphatase [Leptomonas pyrrhocoris]|eukprot:XP_015663568.1 putative membrane-bound acid phosphatase [Leptomonas pyrrhocoris]